MSNSDDSDMMNVADSNLSLGDLLMPLPRLTSSGSGAAKRDYRCQICLKKYDWPSNLKRHEKIHQAVRSQFGCQFCQRTFLYKCSLNDHLMTHLKHGTGFPCPIIHCCEKFARLRELELHVSKHMLPKKGSADCAVCGKFFENPHSLIKHSLIQHKIRNEEVYKSAKKTVKGIQRPGNSDPVSKQIRSLIKSITEPAESKEVQPKVPKCSKCGEGFVSVHDYLIHVFLQKC